MTQWFHRFSLLPLLLRLSIFIVLFLLFFGTLIHFIEPTQYKKIFDGVWWAFITMATIGYGEFIPKTIEGKIVTMMMIITGGSLMAFYLTTMAATIIRFQNNRVKGRKSILVENHLIFIGWNERTKLLTQSFQNEPILLIDETIDEQPIKKPSFYFLKGIPYFDTTLQKANITKAKAVFITADPHQSEQIADMHTILTTLAITSLSPQTKVFAEILTLEQINNAKRAGATQILSSNQKIAHSFLHCFNI